MRNPNSKASKERAQELIMVADYFQREQALGRNVLEICEEGIFFITYEAGQPVSRSLKGETLRRRLYEARRELQWEGIAPVQSLGQTIQSYSPFEPSQKIRRGRPRKEKH